MRFLPCGSDGLLVEVAGLEESLALHAALRTDPLPGTTELVPAARTVLVRFRPELTGAAELAARIRERPLTAAATGPGDLVEVPVHYDGPDLEEVARLCGTTPAEVVRRHTGATWTVAFTGFAPGFAYLAGDDPVLDVPRRSSPRTAIPAGAVGLAGRFSGVYPRASPGGWQLLGRTTLAVWDVARPEPALLRPGTRVRFVEAPAGEPAPGPPAAPGIAGTPVPEPFLEVLAAGTQTLVEDLGRPGRSAQGLSRSGAVDRGALRRANRLVGNPPGAPALEVAGGGLRVRTHGRSVLALTGAPAPLRISTRTGTLEVPAQRPFALDDGEELHVGTPARGVRSVLAVRGGLAVTAVLGSGSTDLLSGTGPDPVRAGDRLPVGAAPGGAVVPWTAPDPEPPAAGDVVGLDVVLGPRDDWFSPATVQRFCDQEWVVTPRSNRVGLRLDAEPLERAVTGELPSEGTVPGAVQVPPDGRPVVFAADHPVTGGYPVIACVAAHHLDLLAQVPPGARVRFRPVTPEGEPA
ncbi:5-oxoprolinase/urea amidolyase family protein [Kineococcus rhizosphaerae]|uniref:5-oxoprolinase/urea amidolyase family protein n=1 Tax=Kineococcus rhizosphaerae TaxID=559628 RepID=UPI000D05952C